jgi:hypothetical protein
MIVSDAFLRKFVNFWSLILFAMIVLDVIFLNSIDSVLRTVSDIYIASLAIYGGNKEFKRWTDNHSNGHKGENIFFFWTAVVFILIILDIVLGKKYKIPECIESSYIAFITVLVITSKSKEFHKKRNKNPV